jgi:hypothetical protein
MIDRSLLRRPPVRVTTGAHVVNSGHGKLHADRSVTSLVLDDVMRENR